jgi:hypothetical protein
MDNAPIRGIDITFRLGLALLLCLDAVPLAAQTTFATIQLRNGNLPADQQSVNRWFDPGAFSAPSPVSFGTSAKGVIIGPGSTSLHAGIAKLFRIRENMQLRWNLIANNAINHPNWSNPGMNVTSQASAGIITSTAGVGGLDESGARALRMGLRFEW